LRIELSIAGRLGNGQTMVEALQEAAQELSAPDSSSLATLDKTFSAMTYTFTSGW
jgi:TRAP-type C4-dicarboxylate transport system substrate-binding protein